MATTLVTGGAGFLGSHLCKRLLDAGHQVFSLDNLLTGDKRNIVPLLDNPHFAFFEHDVTKPFDGLMDRLAEVNYLFHLASPASPNKNSQRSYLNHPIETLLTGSVGTYHLLMLAKEKNTRFLFASTSEVYGNPAVSPQPETYFGNVNPNGERSVYDEAKRFGEAMTFGYRRRYGVNARIIRIFNTYGPNMQRDDGRVISSFITQALTDMPLTIFGDGKQTRSFCYVDDLVEGIMLAMFTKGTDGEVINLGNPDERSVAEIATIIKQMTASHSGIIYQPLPEDDPLQRKPDITKAKTLLGWEPKVSLQAGLEKTIEYFRNGS